MNNLKTLKDLSVEEWKDRKDFVELWVRIDELKQEAIKHIKAKQEARKKYEGSKYGDAGWIAKECLKTDICFIKEFFNITEEEIRE